MHNLKTIIAAHQDELRKHPLFERLASSQSVEEIARMARAIAWWPMVFQDVLRLNAELIRGSGLERFADDHRMEDAGHDRWFLEDLAELSVERLGLDDLFADDFQPIRDACYSLLAAVYAEQPPVQRLAFLRALEPTGHVFFEEVSKAVERLAPDLRLRYFARAHLVVEEAHDLFTASTDADLDKIVLTDEERVRCEAAVARVFAIFHTVFSYLTDRITGVQASEATGNPLYIREFAPSPAGVASPAGSPPLPNVVTG